MCEALLLSRHIYCRRFCLPRQGVRAVVKRRTRSACFKCVGEGNKTAELCRRTCFGAACGQFRTGEAIALSVSLIEQSSLLNGTEALHDFAG
jgi:hypothetical protein